MQIGKLFRKVRNDLGVQMLALYSLFIVPIVIGALFFDQVAGEQLRQEIMAADLALSQAIAQETNTIIENALIAVSDLAKYDGVIQIDDGEMLDIFETGSQLFEQVDQLSTATLVRIAQSGDIVSRALRLVSGS